jgi:predicted nicotinamide N-methyase
MSRLNLLTENIIGTKVGDVIQSGDLVYCGDVLYDDTFASALLPWLQELASEGIDVVVSDPGRWVLLEMSKSERKALLQPIASIEFEKWFSSQNHGLISSSLYRILPPILE